MKKNILTVVLTFVLMLTISVVSAQDESQNSLVLKRKVAIARFSNETQYAKGAFYEKENDPLINQALDILSTKLAASGKFLLLERNEMEKIVSEMKLNGNQAEPTVGADYLILGSITEFGRKNVGDTKVFSRSKTQVVYAGVAIRLVDVSTGQIIYSEEAKGEAETTNKTVLGYGQQVDYDASLNDKAISVAISQLVENIERNCMERPWRSYFLSFDDNGILISGGKSQGLRDGQLFDVYLKGKRIKNPQTGMMMDLPGKKVGQVKITYIGGDNPQNEFSMVEFVDGSIDKDNISDYYITEKK